MLHAPSLGRAIEEAELALDALAAVDASFGRPLGGILTDAIWGSAYRLPSIAGMRPVDPRTVLTRAGLAEAGIDPQAPLLLAFNAKDGVVIARFGLTDRPTFEAWLDRIGGRDRRRLSIGAETASVLAVDSERPVTCLARHTVAICQLGASEGDNPVADLTRIVSGSGTTYGRLEGVVRASRRLARDSALYAFMNPAPLARDAAAIYALRERRRTRFADARTRARAEEEIRRTTARFLKWSKWVDGAAMALVTGERVGMQVELSPTSTGKRLLEGALPARGTDDLIGRWAATPALFSALVHADPAFVQKAAEHFGIDLPKEALSGTIALLGLGLDPECPSAKQGATTELDWAFLVPSALNVGLATAQAADEVHRLLSQRFPLASGKTPWIKHARPPFAGMTAGSPYEIHVLDRMLVVGTGVGSGAAALRRLASLQPKEGGSERAPFLRASVHPRAIDAAFASGNFGREHRRELLAIESLRLQLKPLLERIHAIELVANTSSGHEHVSLDLQVK